MQALPTASLAAANPGMPYVGGPEALLARFAWNVPPDGVDRSKPMKVFYADRYGGNAIHRNGGGARCASDGTWQIKGCGLNPLAGIDNDGSIGRPGTTTLAESLQEALWSEVFQHALPYGSTRICAVIRTGLHDEQAARPCDRVLGMVVREAAWRPAHFQRAHMFRPAPEVAASLPSDTERVRCAVAQLDRLLPVPIDCSPSEWLSWSPLARLNAGMNEMVRRFAEQFAAAVAKRLMHGTVTASNICLDGRWIDFATASALPGWANYVSCLCRLTDEYLTLTQTLATLCFYIGKYFPVPIEERRGLPQPNELVDTYVGHYKSSLDRRMAGLIGCQGVLAQRVWDTPDGRAAMRQLGQILLHLGTSGSSRRYASPILDSSTGTYDVLAILDIIANTSDPVADARLASLIPSKELRTQLLSAHAAVCAAMYSLADRSNLSLRALQRLVCLYRNKAALVEPLFYRDRMNIQLEEMAQDIHDPGQFNLEAERLWKYAGQRARLLYKDPDGFTCLLWCADEGELVYDALDDMIVACWSGQRKRFTWAEFFDADSLATDVTTCRRDMRAFWGEHLWEML
ncbi:hypothetical protein ACEN88_02400 [Massilia sp. CT11-108]|jgi:hypothetical protein|uniref:hypothetical protein n=1 Tax=Massilia sp. CT11-108 TaxID=3393900 RepID=UPI0039A4A0FF